MATELGGMQVTSLLEALPGIAAVLRNPVADAFVGLIKAGARINDFKISDAEEILRYAVRRTLMTQDETDRILAEVRDATDRRAEKAAERERGKAERKAAAQPAKPKAKVAVKARAAVKKPAKAAKSAKKKK